jgi:hypothetical protein
MPTKNEEELSNENKEENIKEPEKENQAEETDDDEDEKIPDAPLDFSITLSDTSGQKISFLQRQIKSRVLKIDFLDENDHSENIFQTFFFDLGKLRVLNSDFQPSLLEEIRFDFDQNEKGVIILDQLGITKAF